MVCLISVIYFYSCEKESALSQNQIDSKNIPNEINNSKTQNKTMIVSDQLSHQDSISLDSLIKEYGLVQVPPPPGVQPFVANNITAAGNFYANAKVQYQIIPITDSTSIGVPGEGLIINIDPKAHPNLEKKNPCGQNHYTETAPLGLTSSFSEDFNYGQNSDMTFNVTSVGYSLSGLTTGVTFTHTGFITGSSSTTRVTFGVPGYVSNTTEIFGRDYTSYTPYFYIFSIDPCTEKGVATHGTGNISGLP